MMNRSDLRNLDNYITGHGGEDFIPLAPCDDCQYSLDCPGAHPGTDECAVHIGSKIIPHLSTKG